MGTCPETASGRRRTSGLTVTCRPGIRYVAIRRPGVGGYIASNVSQTSIVAPPDRTGQPFASAIAASRLSALMTL